MIQEKSAGTWLPMVLWLSVVMLIIVGIGYEIDSKELRRDLRACQSQSLLDTERILIIDYWISEPVPDFAAGRHDANVDVAGAGSQ